jgi:hypothetical protein
MPYIDRDESGNIISRYECAQREGHEFVESAELWIPPLTIEERVAARLAERGLTLETEWQLYGSIAGTLALGALQGKNQATLYTENTGFRNAMNMYTDILFIRSGA